MRPAGAAPFYQELILFLIVFRYQLQSYATHARTARFARCNPLPLRLPQRRNAAYALPALYRKPNPVPSTPTSYSVTQYSASNYTNPYGGGGGGGGARPGNALSSLALSLTTSSSDIVMPVSASYWATELRTISSKDRGALVFFAFSSSLAAAFAPAASSVAAFFSAACGVQPARQHG